MTQAQKIAKDKFKKAIEYKKKTGVSLKEAFAHIYGKKVGAVKKKAAPKKKVVKAKYVKILGQEVKEGTKLHQKLVSQKKYFDDLQKSEIGATKKKTALKKSAPKKKAAHKKSASKRITDIHKDSKSHNVNIKVVSGFIGRLVVKTFTLSELKKMNPVYFEKGKDAAAGIYKRKLITSKKLNSQVMVEAKKEPFTNTRSYSIRLINAEGSIGMPKKFDTIFGAAEYIGKNIIL